MSDALPQSTFQCTQCGGELHPDEGQHFLTCPFCNSTVYLDKSRVVFHWYVAPTLDAAKAGGALARWMAGNHTVKDLDKKAKIGAAQFAYFPLWYFKSKDSKGKETIILKPAAATSVTEITHMHLPPGDLRKYEDRLDADAHQPTVPLDAALDWIADHRKLASSELAESALVHVPIYTFKYDYHGRSYTALVEGSGGGVMANIFPEKADAPYQIVAALAALAFLCLATFPVIGALMGDEAVFMGIAGCIVGGLPVAAVFMALAAWVSQKV
jgi:predicted RNA-binding Zn-ribbon protein involved in translation (DUF1610 family)